MPAAPQQKTMPPAERAPARPLITPRQGQEFWWESNGTFNPGVTEYKDNIILLYRAYDSFHISRLGLAHSRDGVTFTQYPHPAIDTDPADPHERLGIEDPRITKIGQTYYIVHTVSSYHRVGAKADVNGALDYIPWRVRIALHTTKDFKTYEHWNVILPDVPAKNGCLLPEKVDGRFALYYRELTEGANVLKITFSTDLRTWQDTAVIAWPTPASWQAFKFGLGSPPIALPAGYLIVYHAVDEQQIYRLGLMMFDRRDPARILWHSNPILEPTAPYEQEGYVPNVVYCCGALLRDNELWIYYGAADKVIGRAILPLHTIAL